MSTRAPDPRVWWRQMEKIERRESAQRAERPLVLIGKPAWSRAENEVRAFIERTTNCRSASPMGKGVMPDDHPFSVAAARTLALQNERRLPDGSAVQTGFFHFGQPPACEGRQGHNPRGSDIAPRRSAITRRRKLGDGVGDGKGNPSGSSNKEIAARQLGFTIRRTRRGRQNDCGRRRRERGEVRTQIGRLRGAGQLFRALRDVAPGCQRDDDPQRRGQPDDGFGRTNCRA